MDHAEDRRLGLGAEIPRFSVIIPAFNSVRYLARAIDSVLSQEGNAAEIIVVDDASTDGTDSLIRQYDHRVRYLQLKINRGVAAARNFGAQNATGEWLAFLDADDFYYPNRLSLHAEWIAQDPHLDFLTGDYDYQGPLGEALGSSMAQRPCGRKMLTKAGDASRVVMQPDDFEDFVAEHFGDTHTLSVPRRTFLKLCGYPEDFKVCEDVHLLTRLVAVSQRVGVCCTKMGVYVVHGTSATRRDPVQSQHENVRTLQHLAGLAATFPDSVTRGVRRRLRQGRLNLAYALVKAGRRGAALKAVLPSLLENPGFKSTRDLLSILKG